jgi:hypothetical protein
MNYSHICLRETTRNLGQATGGLLNISRYFLTEGARATGLYFYMLSEWVNKELWEKGINDNYYSSFPNVNICTPLQFSNWAPRSDVKYVTRDVGHLCADGTSICHLSRNRERTAKFSTHDCHFGRPVYPAEWGPRLNGRLVTWRELTTSHHETLECYELMN